MNKNYLYFEEVSEGMEIPSVKTGPIERVQLVDYASASGDYNKIHYDIGFAKKAGLKGCIAHGMLVMSMVGTFITKWAKGGVLRDFKIRFLGITNENDTLTFKGRVIKKFFQGGENLIEVKVSSETQEKKITTEGSALISLKSRKE